MSIKLDTQPITQLKNRTAEILREVEERRRPVVVTQKGRAKAVIVDVETFDQWQDTMALLRILAQSQADVDAGRLIPQEEAFARAAAAIRRVK